jgi:hypothetical protein
VTDKEYNLMVLNEAQRTIQDFEQRHNLTTEDMLAAPDGDERLAGVDNFDLMDWHFAIDQVKALKRMVVGTVQAKPIDRFSFRLQYRLTSTVTTVNVTERELELAA